MIILHLILHDFPRVPAGELVEDVEKSLEIFSAMESVIVARRCSELTREMLSVAKRYIHGRGQHKQGEPTADRFGAVPDKLMSSPRDPPAIGTNVGDIPIEPILWNSDFLSAFLSQDNPNPVREDTLANLLDPSILEDFAAGGTATDYAQTVTSTSTRDPIDHAVNREEREDMEDTGAIPPESDSFQGVMSQEFDYGLFDGSFCQI